MACSETQLQTWSHQGSVAQSASTYEIIRNALEDRSAPFASRYFDIFLQGSYGNDTNIYADSDVDIVICLTSVYYHDISNLDASQQSTYNSNFSSASYSWKEFQDEVLQWLKAKFGQSVKIGNKAIFVPGSGGRRDVDVLVCAEHRRYFSYYGPSIQNFAKGVVFWTSSGTEIVNFPGQHHDNCATKHQLSAFRFKPNVRVLKNYRNSLITSGKLSDGVAPSYFLEGLLWNMPPSQFDPSFTATMNNFIDWVSTASSVELSCANDLHYLVRNGVAVCWPTTNFQAYVNALQADW